MIEGMFDDGPCVIIVTKDNGAWHLSISCKDRLPTYDEMKAARYKYLSDNITVAQVFPPSKDFVNVHPYCLHLWELRKSELPEGFVFA